MSTVTIDSQHEHATPGHGTPFHSQNGEDIVAWKAMGDSAGPHYFVEVGVIDGVRFSNTLLFERQGWRGLCVEAHPDFVERVRRNRPGSTVIHAAAAETSAGSVPFHADPRGDLSTLVAKDDAEMRQRFGNDFDGFRLVQVPARTLDDMLAEAGAPSDFELLSIDIEGAELPALRGLNFERWRPRLLIIESESPEDRAALRGLMDDRGYHFARRVGMNDLYTRTRRDMWRVRLVRVHERVVHAGNPADPSPVDRVYIPSSYETRSQYFTRLMRTLAQAA